MFMKAVTERIINTHTSFILNKMQKRGFIRSPFAFVLVIKVLRNRDS